MNRKTKLILLAGALSTAASFCVALPAATADAHTVRTDGMPVHCYAWPHEKVAAARREGDIVVTGDIQVTVGSPCRDVNVRAVTRNGRSSCATLRLRWGGDNGSTTTPWRFVCGGWRVAAANAQEGDVFRVEVQGWTPVGLTERS